MTLQARAANFSHNCMWLLVLAVSLLRSPRAASSQMHDMVHLRSAKHAHQFVPLDKKTSGLSPRTSFLSYGPPCSSPIHDCSSAPWCVRSKCAGSVISQTAASPRWAWILATARSQILRVPQWHMRQARRTVATSVRRFYFVLMNRLFTECVAWLITVRAETWCSGALVGKRQKTFGSQSCQQLPSRPVSIFSLSGPSGSQSLC